jgi:alkanesulfonate monooxygenase SsuD/methylene tetrahydromethanopterin reductase-like flavin-dependent oxidoreductase (luciferase family)
VKISLFYEFALPRPWTDDDEQQMFADGLEEVEAADKAGFSTVWLTEHHFLEEYCHATAPEIFLGAAAARTTNIRLGHGIVHLPPPINHPARVAERIATLDLISGGRVEFGTGESSSVGELGGFGVDPADKRTMWEEALQVSVRAMTEHPFTGFEGKHVSMPARNVIPKPVQKPHPPLWVACTRPSSVQMAAEHGIGALSFAYTGPEALGERVRGYYQHFEDHGAPSVPQLNPNVLAIGGDLSMMVAPTDEQAVQRLGIGGGFFSFGILHYYMTGQHTPGRTGVWDLYQQAVEADPTVAYGPGRGAIGSPDTVAAFLRGYEASGVDEIILLLNPRSHEGTMESIELMGSRVLPEFIERHEKAAAAKARRLEPVIEKVEARRRPWAVPAEDPDYSFGGLPTGRGGSFTAQEIPEAMAEIEEGQKQAAERAAAQPGQTQSEQTQSGQNQRDKADWQ